MNVNFWLENFTNGVRSGDLNICHLSRTQWPCGLWCSSAASRLLGWRVQIQLVARMSVAHAVSVDSSPCDETITHSEEFYRVCVCVCVCASCASFSKFKKRRPKSDLRLAPQKVKGHVT